MPLAFSPFHWWPIVILSPALLIHLHLRAVNSLQAFLLGWFFGLGYFGFGVYWLYNSLHVYGHAPVVLAVALTALMVVTLAAFIGAGLALHHRLLRNNKNDALLWILPLIWFGMEWFKGWVLTGFPWLAIGYAHVDSWLAGFAPWIGVYGIGAISIALSIMVVQLDKKRLVKWLALIGAPFLLGFMLQVLDLTRPQGRPLEITMIQGNIDQARKWRWEERPKIIRSYWQASAEHWDSDLVIWPEVAIPGRSDELEKALLQPMRESIREHGGNLLTGILVSDRARDTYYNSMMLLGQNSGQYHKRHLVPFGEFYPFRDLLSFMRAYIRIPMSDMSPGPDQQTLMRIDDSKLGVSICYEDVFSRDVNLDLPEANILINTSNDAWFGDSLAPHQHLQIARMRAIETGRPLVRSTNTGQSAFIDFKGNITSATDTFIEQTLSAPVQGRSGTTPFLYFAAIQPWLAWLILVVSLWMARRPKRAST